MNTNSYFQEKTAMTGEAAETALRRIARIAGVLYLIIIVAGIFAEFAVRSSLKVPGDATTTANNIMAAQGLFRLGIMSDLMMIMSDVAIGLAFYILLKPVSNALALLAAFFRLAQATILGINLLNLFFVTQLLGGADYLSVLGTEQVNAQALLFLDAHSAGYSIGLVFFGFSILILSTLIYRSGYFPRVLGILLFISAIGYLVDSSASLLLPNYADYADLFGMIVSFAFIAEPALALWLLIKGIRSPSRSSIAKPAQAKGLAA